MAIQDLEITPRMADVLKVFLEEPEQPHYGFELMKLTGQASGSLYPLLAKLEQAGWLTRGKEDIDPVVEGRAPRMFYKITGDAAQAAHTQLTKLSARYAPPAPIKPRPAFGGGR